MKQYWGREGRGGVGFNNPFTGQDAQKNNKIKK
jgi:hypothetical protein